MKIAATLSLVGLMLSTLFEFGESATVVRTVFEAPSGECSLEDWNVIYSLRRQRRQQRKLRGSEVVEEDAADADAAPEGLGGGEADVDAGVRSHGDNRHHRRLEPWWCAQLCANWPPGRCWIRYPSCTESRRRMASDGGAGAAQIAAEPIPELAGSVRELVDAESPECVTAKARTTAALDNALGRVSADCQALISTARTLTCLDILEETEVEVQNTITNLKLYTIPAGGTAVAVANANFNQGGAFCRAAFTIEVEAGTLVGKVSFLLEGIDRNYIYQHTENERRFYMFANSGTTVGSRLLAVGSYRLTLVPDNNTKNAKVVYFSITQC